MTANDAMWSPKARRSSAVMTYVASCRLGALSKSCMPVEAVPCTCSWYLSSIHSWNVSAGSAMAKTAPEPCLVICQAGTVQEGLDTAQSHCFRCSASQMTEVTDACCSKKICIKAAALEFSDYFAFSAAFEHLLSVLLAQFYL